MTVSISRPKAQNGLCSEEAAAAMQKAVMVVKIGKSSRCLGNQLVNPRTKTFIYLGKHRRV